MIAFAPTPATLIRPPFSSRFVMPENQEERVYYQHRLLRSQEMAALSQSPSARAVHLEFARLYREKLNALGKQRVGDPS